MICYVEKFVQLDQTFCMCRFSLDGGLFVVYCRLLLSMEFHGYLNNPGSIEGACRHRASILVCLNEDLIGPF